LKVAGVLGVTKKKNKEPTMKNNKEVMIVVSPHENRPGRFYARLEGEVEMICLSRQPFLESARKLLARGHDPSTLLVMRHAGSGTESLRGPLWAAAKLTVDEQNGTVFAKWKAFPCSAGSPRIGQKKVRARPGYSDSIAAK